MTDIQLRTIRTGGTVDAAVQVPPSKSYTNRALIVGALAEGQTTLRSPSLSDDSHYLVQALQHFGIDINRIGDDLEITGTSGNLHAPSKEIYVGNAGTSMRFLTTLACIAHGETIITGDEQMQKRPIQDLLDALRSAGIRCSSNDGFPPVKISGGNFPGGAILINATVSSQFVSSILLCAPYAKHPVSLQIKGKLSSLPYVDMSLHVMRSFGATINFIEPSIYKVGNLDHYLGQSFQIEGDASSASYFFAAAAITHGRVTIDNLTTDSLQGDIKFLEILKQMGCTVIHGENMIEVRGNKLFGIEIDMNDLPDCVPTLAIVAAFAETPTTIRNVAHLQFKESNRLTALATELTKMGAKVELYEDGITIKPHLLHGAQIETYNDHRMAMSFAVAGLQVPDVTIVNPSCVSKSFPNFWDEFSKLERME